MRKEGSRLFHLVLVLLGNKPQDMEYNWTLNKSTVHVHSAFSHNMIAPLNFERRLDSFREAPTYKNTAKLYGDALVYPQS